MKRFIERAVYTIAILGGIWGVAWGTNYTMTQGAGTTFGSLVVSAVNYAQQLVCDPTTPTQCMAVGSTGAAAHNVAQINAVTPLMGNGVTGTGSQRVTIASDNTAFSVNAAVTNAGTFATQLTGATNNINNIAGTVSLPTGAATSALQPTNAAQGSTTSGQTGHLVECAVTTAAPSYTTAQTDPLSCTTTGDLRVSVTNTLSAIATGAGQTASPVATFSGASRYQAVAASQTATVLQASAGATGDYLSHCVIYPQSTSPGVVTVFDNTNTAANSAVLFAGGASSTSNLTPISVPVGALSLNGAWKVTTGASVSVVCYGKFS